jgi:hypothetical protein
MAVMGAHALGENRPVNVFLEQKRIKALYVF